MKQPIAIAILALTLITGLNEIHISGKLTRPADDKKERSFDILVKTKEGWAAKTSTKANGQFELSFGLAGNDPFDLYFIDPSRKPDTFFLRSFRGYKSTELKADCQAFNRHVDDDNNVICPKCGRADDVNSGQARSMGYYYCSRDAIKF